jgi:hypothetical protein
MPQPNHRAGGRPGDRAAPSARIARGIYKHKKNQAPSILLSQRNIAQTLTDSVKVNMITRTAEEATQARIDALGPEFGPLFRHIETDLYSLRILWRVYVAFYGTSKERVELLNASSGTTAFLLENTLFDSAILSLCRMTDPPSGQRGQSTNTTIKRFPHYLEDHSNLESLERLIDDAHNKTSFARSWRNKKIAHSDYDVRQNKAELDTASRRDVLNAIGSIATVIRWVGHECLDCDIITHPIQNFLNDEVQFLEHIFLGQQKDRDLEERSRALLEKAEYEAAKEISKCNSQAPSPITGCSGAAVRAGR